MFDKWISIFDRYCNFARLVLSNLIPSLANKSPLIVEAFVIIGLASWTVFSRYLRVNALSRIGHCYVSQILKVGRIVPNDEDAIKVNTAVVASPQLDQVLPIQVQRARLISILL